MIFFRGLILRKVLTHEEAFEKLLEKLFKDAQNRTDITNRIYTWG
jgi:hypothetical protein